MNQIIITSEHSDFEFFPWEEFYELVETILSELLLCDDEDIDSLCDTLSFIKDKIHNKFNLLPMHIQEGDIGEQIITIIENVTNFINHTLSLEDTEDKIKYINESLNQLKGELSNDPEKE